MTLLNATSRFLLLVAVSLSLGTASPANAGIISTLAKFGKTAKVAGVAGAGGLLADSLGLIKRLPDEGSVRRLAVGADADGHIRLGGVDGEEWVVSSSEELSNLLSKAGPSAPGSLKNRGDQVTEIYISDETLYQQGRLFSQLPQTVELRLIHRGDKHYRVTNTAATGPPNWNLQVSDNVHLEFTHPELLDEMLFRLHRALKPNSIRLLRLEPDHPAKVAALGRRDEGGFPIAESVDPARLDTQLRSIRGQTAIISGRIEGDSLVGGVGKAGLSRTPLKTLRAAAADADVNLVIMDTANPAQFGDKGLFGKMARLPELERALRQNTLGDFLDSLAPPGGPMVLSAQRQGSRYVAISARPPEAPVETDALVLLDAPRLAMHSILIVTRDKSETEEHDRRIFSWLPTWVLMILVGNLVLGIMAWSTAWSRWWKKLWKPVSREACAHALHCYAVRLIRLVAFVMLFLPLAGGLAFVHEIVMVVVWVFWALFRVGLWLLLLPVRVVRWFSGGKARS